MDGCEPPCYWELNLGPLEEQPVLLASKPFLQSQGLTSLGYNILERQLAVIALSQGQLLTMHGQSPAEVVQMLHENSFIFMNKQNSIHIMNNINSILYNLSHKYLAQCSTNGLSLRQNLPMISPLGTLNVNL